MVSSYIVPFIFNDTIPLVVEGKLDLCMATTILLVPVRFIRSEVVVAFEPRRRGMSTVEETYTWHSLVEFWKLYLTSSPSGWPPSVRVLLLAFSVRVAF